MTSERSTHELVTRISTLEEQLAVRDREIERLLGETDQPTPSVLSARGAAPVGQSVSPSSRVTIVCPHCRTQFPAALAAA